jgi:regulator of Ty1 transposition protein 109
MTTAYYHWPAEGRGDRLVDEAEYKRIVELLLHLDFSTFDKAAGSTQRWLSEAGLGDGLETEVVGRLIVCDPLKVVAGASISSVSDGKVTNLTGLIKRKPALQSSETDARRNLDPNLEASDGPAVVSPDTQPVNVLGGNLIRKKKKDMESTSR